MKGMKGKFLKKLKSIGQIGSIRHGRVLQMHASDGLSDPIPPVSGHVFRTPLARDLSPPETDSIDIAEIMRDLGEEEEEEEDMGRTVDMVMEKENIRPAVVATKTMAAGKENSEIECRSSLRQHQQRPLSELDKCSFRRPEWNSGNVFDPDLLAAFQQVVTVHLRTYEPNNRKAENIVKEEPIIEDDPLLEFELRGPPPGGSDAAVLYTTSIRGIRKTFEDCNSLRFLLGSLKIAFIERDVSMHMEYREELWRILGGRVVPPRLFIRGRYIGGADQVLGLHEQGRLVGLLKGLSTNCSFGQVCDECAGIRFILCFECSGSRKIMADDGFGSIRCPSCNENGLIVCPSCC